LAGGDPQPRGAFFFAAGRRRVLEFIVRRGKEGQATSRTHEPATGRREQSMEGGKRERIDFLNASRASLDSQSTHSCPNQWVGGLRGNSDGWRWLGGGILTPPRPFFCRLLRDGFPQAARHSCRLAWRARALGIFAMCVCLSLSRVVSLKPSPGGDKPVLGLSLSGLGFCVSVYDEATESRCWWHGLLSLRAPPRIVHCLLVASLFLVARGLSGYYCLMLV